MKEQYHLFKDKTILIVEDTASCYSLLEIILKRMSIKTIWAKNGKEAIQICEENDQIDLALMDVRMPKMNGYDASRIIKHLRPKLPIVMQTAYGVSNERERALAAGCDDYISKPINREKLIGILRGLLL